MKKDSNFAEINPQLNTQVPSAAQVAHGLPVPPIRLLEVMSPDDWEIFTEEWLSYQKDSGSYQSIRRYSGPGDLGLDVVAFTDEIGFAAEWDSYQCKHYDHALTPEDVCSEIGKIIYHSFLRTPPFNQKCSVPRSHVFIAPRGVGITVGRWLKDADTFKKEVLKRWEKQCVSKLGKGISAPLEGELLSYIEAFNFEIFSDRTGVELIAEHSKTVFHAPRFGGGLPSRGATPKPPEDPSDHESIYLRKILEAYGEHLGKSVQSATDIAGESKLSDHYNRQRVLFYSAEALRNFARDRTPLGTFSSLQEDVYNGVIDVCESDHDSGLVRLRATISTAGSIDVSGNGLASVTRVADKQGVCHQLANDARLNWVNADD